MAAKTNPTERNDNSRTNTDHPSTRTAASEDADRQTNADRSSAGTGREDLASKSAAAIASLYRQGRRLLAENKELADATRELSKAVEKNPLGAVAIAFAAGLVLALLTRG